MIQTIKKLLMPVAAFAALSLGSCSDWTDTESVDMHYPTLEEQNPELYKKYMEALRAYKQGEHKITYVSLQNSTEAPAQRNHHLTTLPDSVDFVRLMTPANLHPMLVKEIQEVHEKGTRVVYPIDYAVIEAQWKKILEEEAAKPETPAALEEGGEAPVEPTELERFVAYCTEQTTLQLAYCDQFGFDGVEFCYEGRATQGMTETVKTDYTARQNAFLGAVTAWQEKHADKLLFFRGNPQNLIDPALMNKCNYLVIPVLSAASGDKISYAVRMAMTAGVPTDRFLVAVTIPSLVDPTSELGYFNGYEADGKTRIRATKGAALWSVEAAAGYTKSGIAIDDAQNDYYNITFVYKNLRAAIGIMNPAPKY